MKLIAYCFFLLLALCSLPLISIADHITVQGEVSGHWASDTVMVTGDLSIPESESLLINPGTMVRFMGSYEFIIEGTLIASGTENDSVFFLSADTSGFYIDSIQDGGWKGIRFAHTRAANDSSVFTHCRFSFGKNINEDLLKGNGGVLSIRDFNKVRINNCTFTDNYSIYNGGALALDSADVMITDCFFTRNRSGLTVAPWGYGGAVCSDNSSPEIRRNTFSGNSSTGVGGGLSVRYKDCNVYSNVFTGNVSGLGGALCVLHIPEINFRVNNNLMAGNSAVYFGGGVATMDANPIYINNTIVYNTAIYGGGFYCKDSISPDFYNTIFWGNTASVGSTGYLFEVYSQADFFYCLVQGGPSQFGGSGGGEAFFGTYESCIEQDPLFAGSGEHPYDLTWDSPCYNTGSSDTSGFMLPEFDLAGNPRVSHNTIDMGAYEIVWVDVEAWGHGGIEARGHGDINVWPNPTTGEFKVQSAKFKDGVFSVELSDIWGRRVFDVEEGSGGEPVEFDISHLPDGIYFALIRNRNETFSQKLIKVSH